MALVLVRCPVVDQVAYVVSVASMGLEVVLEGDLVGRFLMIVGYTALVDDVGHKQVLLFLSNPQRSCRPEILHSQLTKVTHGVRNVPGEVSFGSTVGIL